MSKKERKINYDENALQNEHKNDIVSTIHRTIKNPIDNVHPTDVLFGNKGLSQRQQMILDKLPDYNSRVTVNKNDVSMIDLSTLTAITGDEFAMFTISGKRLVVRGNSMRIPLLPEELHQLAKDGYRFSGHTHPGFTDISLIASQGDKEATTLFNQKNSAIYNAAGRFRLIYPKERR